MVPFVFLGVGFYRAWIEIAFVGSFVSFPAIPFGARECFDGVGAIVMLICVLLARRIGPFYRHPSIFVLCGACMTLATIALFATMIVPESSVTRQRGWPLSSAVWDWGLSFLYGARCSAA